MRSSPRIAASTTLVWILGVVSHCAALSAAWSLGIVVPMSSSTHRLLALRQQRSAPPLRVYLNDNGEQVEAAGDYTEQDELSDEELEASAGKWNEKIARFNTVHLTGRVGNSPEARYFDDGKVVVNLSMASRRKYHGMDRKTNNIKTGEEETDWYGLEIWGQTAEFVAKFVDKGARIGVVGQLQIDTWTDKATGEARNRAKIVVRDLDVLETRAEAELRRGEKRGPSFYTEDDDDEDFSGPSKAGTGGFFDMM